MFSSIISIKLKRLLNIGTRSIDLLISSNLRSNLKVMFLYFGPVVLIVNGLGRYRHSLLRKIIGILLGMRVNDSVHIQNYADYRYYRRFYQPKVWWMAGSGGVRRSKCSEGIFVVTRDSKFPLVEPSISKFLSFRALTEINIIGLSRLELQQGKFLSVGYVPQSELFHHGSEIYIPSGYGEGIPHVLVDAMCSDIKIWLEKRAFIQFGLYNIVDTYSVYSEFICIDPSKNEAAVESLHANNVSKVFFDNVYVDFPKLKLL